MPQGITARLLLIQLFAHLLKRPDQRILHHRLDQKIHRFAFNGGVDVFNFIVAGQNHHPDIAALGLHPLASSSPDT